MPARHRKLELYRKIDTESTRSQKGCEDTLSLQQSF